MVRFRGAKGGRWGNRNSRAPTGRNATPPRQFLSLPPRRPHRHDAGRASAQKGNGRGRDAGIFGTPPFAGFSIVHYGPAVTLSFLGSRQLSSLHAWTAMVSSRGLSSPLARVTVIGIVALSS